MKGVTDAMLSCPMCKTDLPNAPPRCPRCQADLSLLSDFVTDLKTLLEKADAQRRAGEIAAAVQSYLAVLEVDPTNAEARGAVGPVLLAVRTAEQHGHRHDRFDKPLYIVAAAFVAGLTGAIIGIVGALKWLWRDWN
jgi:hypothetical protein